MSDEQIVGEPEDNEEAMGICQDVQGDLNDVVNHIDADDAVKALEDLESAQEKLDALHVYLTGKIESEKPSV